MLLVQESSLGFATLCVENDVVPGVEERFPDGTRYLVTRVLRVCRAPIVYIEGPGPL